MSTFRGYVQGVPTDIEILLPVQLPYEFFGKTSRGHFNPTYPQQSYVNSNCLKTPNNEFVFQKLKLKKWKLINMEINMKDQQDQKMLFLSVYFNKS